MTAGAGLSGELALSKLSVGSGSDPRAAGRLAQIAAAPGMAPWVGGRFGITGSNEAGLTYTGRNLRIDVRHAFALGTAALSVGIGGSVIAAERPGQDVEGAASSAAGSTSPSSSASTRRATFTPSGSARAPASEALNGHIAASQVQTDALALSDVSARHFFGGFVVGVRGGFRHIHVAIEVDGAYHRADGSIFGSSTGVGLFSLTPSGALVISF